LNPLRSDASCDGQARGWTSLDAAKDLNGGLKNNSRKPRDITGIVTVVFTLSQGKMKKGDICYS
jgi:hypothetical protein